MFHIFQTSSNSEFIAVDTTGAESVPEVEAILSKHGWAGTNFYGAFGASTKEEAIEEAKKSKYFFRSANEMKNLAARLNEFTADGETNG